MRTIHDLAERVRILERLAGLSADSERRWGSLDAAAMLYHVNAGIRRALGELEAEPVGDPAFWHTRGRSAALGQAPWPEGPPTFPEALATGPVDFDSERAALRDLLERQAARDFAGDWPSHPRLGPLTGEEWSRLTYNHIQHHFRQFGI